MAVSRLKKRVQFLAVASHKKVVKTLTMKVQLRERPLAELPVESLRVGFTASRYVGKAVVRNRARRRLKALVSYYGPLLKLNRPVDLVIIATQATAKAPFNQLIRDFFYSLKRFAIIQSSQ